ncbi:sugar MFS transporter [Hymenobacter setariae]|uniref:Sugar MFS transporter n=1 Tax=Hymenobacter setariae TaxID=2594794 RepID=A0A558BPD6_9BACT|nr:sugar MFS transporter [Hymenobacter setariae]TVT38362.1 sugar MFS transporter [Hymenobacter setariae]
MAAPAPTITRTSSTAAASTQRYTSALAAVTTLFFLWGFITCLNDILIPYLKAIFQLSFAQANLINLCFFGAYFLMSIPAGKLVARLGYKKGMLLGFVVAAVGAFLFYPAAAQRAYGLFLGALFVLASGITLLQVAANPYVAILGPPESASSRLSLTQAFNSLGVTLAPVIGSYLILKHLPTQATPVNAASIDVSAVQIPYLVIGLLLLAISFLLSKIKLPVIEHATASAGDAENTIDGKRAWNYTHLVFGVIGIFAYVGAEVAIGSHLVNYFALPDVMGFTEEQGGQKLAFYGFFAMIGRFAGVYILNKFSPAKVLAFTAVGAVALVLISINTTGAIAMWSLLAVGLMNSIMYPTIFTLAVAGLGRHTEEGSGLLCTAIVGGALVPMLFGAIADQGGLRLALLLPIVCYAYIMWYGLRGSRRASGETVVA